MVPVAASDPRNWLLTQPQLLFVLLAGAVWLFNVIARARAAASNRARGSQEAVRPELGSQGGPAAQDPDDEFRSRRVREEILRKIAERRAGARAPQPARVREERMAPEPPAIAEAAPAGSRGLEELAAAARFAGAQPRANAPAGGAQGLPAGALWLDDLRSRDTARRAILAREILGPPIALR
jgi:hypothetical protein